MTTRDDSKLLNWLLITCGSLLIFGIAFFIVEIKNKSDSSMQEINVDVELTTLPGFIPNQKDDWDISFSTPDGMREDEAAARKSGVYKVYKSANRKKVHPESVIAISFVKKVDNRGLNNFILEYAEHLKSLFPHQTLEVGIIHLNKEVTRKFEFLGLRHETVSFLLDDKKDKPGYTCAIFFFETPAGYWTINWTAPGKILMRNGRERNIFIGLIKYTLIAIHHPETKNLEVHF